MISPDPAPVPAVDAQARSSIAVLEQALSDLVIRLDALRDEVRAFVAAYRKWLLAFAESPVVSLARYRVSRHREDPVLAGIFEKAQPLSAR